MRRKQDGVPLRIIDGWKGGDLTKTVKKGTIAKCMLGDGFYQMRDGHASTPTPKGEGQIRRGNDLIDGEDVGLDIQNGRKEKKQKRQHANKSRNPATSESEMGCSRDMGVIHRCGKRPLLPKEEWDCLADDTTWDIRRHRRKRYGHGRFRTNHGRQRPQE